MDSIKDVHRRNFDAAGQTVIVNMKPKMLLVNGVCVYLNLTSESSSEDIQSMPLMDPPSKPAVTRESSHFQTMSGFQAACMSSIVEGSL